MFTHRVRARLGSGPRTVRTSEQNGNSGYLGIYRAGVSRRTVASWVQQGILAPDFVTAGGHYRFRWSSVERRLRERRERGE